MNTSRDCPVCKTAGVTTVCAPRRTNAVTVASKEDVHRLYYICSKCGHSFHEDRVVNHPIQYPDKLKKRAVKLLATDLSRPHVARQLFEEFGTRVPITTLAYWDKRRRPVGAKPGSKRNVTITWRNDG